MNKKFVIVILLIISIPLFGQVDRSKMPEPGEAHEIQIGDPETFELENGLKVFVVENNKLPRVVFSLVLDRDPIMEGDNAGYISIAGQLLRTGTKSRTKDQIDEEVDFMGAVLNTSSTGIFARSLTKHVESLLDIMSDIVLNAEFRQEELDKIKKQTISALQMQKDDPSSIANNVRKVLTYGKDHPYGELEAEETVESITLDMCNKYYETYFRPNIAYLSIVGDISTDDAEKLVKKYLGSWQQKEVPSFTYETPKAPSKRTVAVVDRSNSVQSVINITYPLGLKKNSEDVLKVGILNTILGGTSTARLFMNLREDKGFTYGAYSSIASDRLVGNFVARCDGRNAITDSAVTEFLHEMERIRDEKVTEEELQSAINYQSGSFSRSLEQPETIANFAINIARFDLPKDFYKNYLKNLSAVTVDDVNNMAKKYIHPDKAYVLVVGNAEEVAEGLKQFSADGKVDYYDIYGEKYDPSMKKIPEGVTVETVLNKYVDAIGGRENLLKIEDKKTVLKGSIQGMEMNIEIYQKAPNKYYQVVTAGAMKQETKFDGEKGKSAAMGQEQSLAGEMLEMIKVQAAMRLPLDYAKYGVTPELAGLETQDGQDVYKVNLVLESGKKIVQYYSADSGLLAKQMVTVTMPQGSFTQTFTFDDYQERNGVKFPFKLTQSFGPQSINLEVVSMEVNSGLDDSTFEIK
jgi:predicted Zn-dependent peptidase